MGRSKIEVILLMIESWLKSPMSCDIAYLKDGTFICEYDSAASASLATNVRETYIYRCCSGSRVSAGGYVWKYVDMQLGDLCG